MPALIIQFRQRRQRPAVKTDTDYHRTMQRGMAALDRKLDTIADIIGQELLREYAAYPIAAVDLAVTAARAVITGGGSFIDSMEAADRVIRACEPDRGRAEVETARNFQRIMTYRRRRARLVAAVMTALEPRIRVRLADHDPLDIDAAVERARRVLEGGGDVRRAMFHAVGNLPEGRA